MIGQPGSVGVGELVDEVGVDQAARDDMVDRLSGVTVHTSYMARAAKKVARASPVPSYQDPASPAGVGEARAHRLGAFGCAPGNALVTGVPGGRRSSSPHRSALLVRSADQGVSDSGEEVVVSSIVRTRGFMLGISLGAAIALVGVLLGVAVASIPNSNGVIYGCYSTRTGALRVINYPSQRCVSGEKALNWNQRGPSGPASLSALDNTACSLPTGKATAHMEINAASGEVTFRCMALLSVKSTMKMTRILITAPTEGNASKECDNATSCSLLLPLGTADATVDLRAASDFNYTCPGGTTQGSYLDVYRTFHQAQCTGFTLRGDATIPVSPRS